MNAGRYIIYADVSDEKVFALIPHSGATTAGSTVDANTYSDTPPYYWTVAASGNDWTISNVNTGKNGFMTRYNVEKKPVQQSKVNGANSAWTIEDTQDTMIVDGQTVTACRIKVPGSNPASYLTVPTNGGVLELSALDASKNQNFYFKASTAASAKFKTTLSNLTAKDQKKYVVNDSSNSSSFVPEWQTSNVKNTVHEIRYRSRLFDMDGEVITSDSTDQNGWDAWSSWTKVIGTPIPKTNAKDKQRMRAVKPSNTSQDFSLPLPSLKQDDEFIYSSAEVSVQVRCTDAKNSDAYSVNTTMHSTAIAAFTMAEYYTPTVDFTAAVYSPDGLALTYETNYVASGGKIVINNIINSAGDVLVTDYTFDDIDYINDLYLSCDELASVPSENELILIDATIYTKNVAVKGTCNVVRPCSYLAASGLSIGPRYYQTAYYYTLWAAIEKYDVTQCYMKYYQMDGRHRWLACDILADGLTAAQMYSLTEDAYYQTQAAQGKEYIMFDVVPPYNTYVELLWICVDSEANWTSTLDESPSQVVYSDAYSWYWMGAEYNEEGERVIVPNIAILKYQVGEIMKPADTITLSSTEFITTGREYPVYRYNKTVKRNLDIEGVILNSENEPFCTKDAFEHMATSGHFIYRQPDGKWYQVAVQSITFTRDEEYVKVQIKQGAETR